MADINKETVTHIAKLARLSLSDAEIEGFTKDLSQIIKYVEQLEELDTTGVEPMVGAVTQQKALRKDQAEQSNLREAMLANAPSAEENAFKVPQMS